MKPILYSWVIIGKMGKKIPLNIQKLPRAPPPPGCVYALIYLLKSERLVCSIYQNAQVCTVLCRRRSVSMHWENQWRGWLHGELLSS